MDPTTTRTKTSEVCAHTACASLVSAPLSSVAVVHSCALCVLRSLLLASCFAPRVLRLVFCALSLACTGTGSLLHSPLALRSLSRSPLACARAGVCCVPLNPLVGVHRLWHSLHRLWTSPSPSAKVCAWCLTLALDGKGDRMKKNGWDSVYIANKNRNSIPDTHRRPMCQEGRHQYENLRRPWAPRETFPREHKGKKHNRPSLRSDPR